MASKAIGFLNFKFGADLAPFERAMKKAQKRLKRFGKNIQKTGKTLTTGLTLPIVALGAASVKAFDEQAKAIAQVEAGLKSTGGTVGFTAKELDKMASAMQKVTTFGDDEILKNVTAQLLTFTNITGEQFERTQKFALDLATRLDGDLKAASIMLGKALNDPVANLSALSRAGIQFSKEQKTLVKSLVESGNVAQAQTLILEELEKQYGGSAEAAAKAGMGPIKQLQNEIGDLSEQIGERLIPYIKSFVSWIKKLAEKFDRLSESTKDNIVKWGLIFAAIGPVLIIVGKISIGIAALIPLFTSLGMVMAAQPWLLVAAGVAVLITKLYLARDATSALEKANKNVTRSLASDMVTIDRFTGVLKDENATMKEQQTALSELKKAYPGFYNEIDISNISVTTLDESTKKLTASLEKNAKATAYHQKMVDLQKEIIDTEIELKKVREEGSSAFSSYYEKTIDFINTPVRALTGLSKMENLHLNKLEKNLIKQTADLKELSAALDELGPTGSDNFNDLGNGATNATNSIGKTGEAIKQLKMNFDDVILTGKQTTDMLKDFFKGPEKVEPIEFKTSGFKSSWDELRDYMSLEDMNPFQEFQMRAEMTFASLGDGLEEFWERYMEGALTAIDAVSTFLGSTAAKETRIFENEKQTRENLLEDEYKTEKERLENTIVDEKELKKAISQLDDDYKDDKEDLSDEMDIIDKQIKTKQAKREKAMGILTATISGVEAVMASIAASPLTGGLPWAAIVAGLAAANVATIASTPIPVFAEGGLVTGPTVGLIGEVSSSSNPEVVAPLNKLKQFMGGEKIEVVGKLIGNDIYLSNRKTEFNRMRTA